MKTPKEILQCPYSRVLVPEEDGRFSASILEFTGCFSSGDSAAQAYANLEEAATSWVEAALDQKIDIPGPLVDQRAGVRLLLRLPRSLHQRLRALAERDGASFNQYVVAALAERVGAVTTGALLVSEAQKLVRGVTQVLRAATVRLTSFCRKKPHAR